MNLFKVNKLIIFVVFKYYCKIVKLVFVLSMNIIREIYIRKKKMILNVVFYRKILNDKIN